MKHGRTVNGLAAEITRQKAVKRDFIAPSDSIRMRLGIDDQQPTRPLVLAMANGNGGHEFGMQDLFHDQMADRLGIPSRYYWKMMAEQPGLLTENVNTWLADAESRYMVRTLDGKARAFLSDRYRPLDNADLAEAILPTLGEREVEIVSCEITERRLYIKAVDKRITRDIPTGKKMGDASHTFFDTLSPAIIISNSEVGCGALAIETGIWTKVCTNLAIAAQRSMRKYHIGGRFGGNDLGEGMYEMLTDKTKQLTDQALWAQTRDIVAAAFDRAKFDAIVGVLAPTAGVVITKDPAQVIEVFAEEHGMAETERASVLRHLIEGGDLTQYGLFNAVTRTAEDVVDYDRATAIERLGWDVVELEPAYLVA